MAKLTLNVSDEVADEIEKFARREGVTKTEAMRRILSLVKVSNEESKKGRSLGVIQDHGGKLDVVAKLIGV
ncbi:ribbon-helix-helix protein, CopG family [Paraburkholderia sp. BL25I1N1]|uniref:ribbon-helix-helix protein, CopG family n=1 Tax=Paraburkholderia sp. BL25I1N1 TaxID=1938804 RepID=UPI000D05DBBD|nr:ribbon-helix-helix protein, CopG family [Paraburkholderia sp. BL25I1N1]PRY03783.1 ribbon-helix-helix CopG family protein [Paraburkholderia sp. BL25I1N1]